MRRLLGCAACFFLTIIPTLVHAAAWTLPKGKYQWIADGYWYQSTDFFSEQSTMAVEDAPGAFTLTGLNGSYRKMEAISSLERGWTDRTTIGAKLSVARTYETLGGSALGSGVPFTFEGTGFAQSFDTELYVRHKLAERSGWVFSVQPLVKLPRLVVSASENYFQAEQSAVELRGLAGYSFPYGGQYHFINMEAAYRQYLEADSGELRTDFTVGYRPAENWLILGQLFTTFDGYYYHRKEINTTDLAAKMLMVGVPVPASFDRFLVSEGKYSLAKLQLSGVYQFSKDKLLQLGMFKSVYEDNIGGNDGIMISFWKSF